nr:hypothetical protein [Tanacetum cinerariifolium]
MSIDAFSLVGGGKGTLRGEDVVRVNTLKLKKFMNFSRSRKAGMIWSFSFSGGESDEFVLNYEGDTNDAGVMFLKSDLTIKVQNKTRDNWLINFVETIEMFVEVCDSRRNTGCLGYFENVRIAGKEGEEKIECLIINFAEGKDCLAN